MIEDHLGYRSINRGALPLSLGRFILRNIDNSAIAWCIRHDHSMIKRYVTAFLASRHLLIASTYGKEYTSELLLRHEVVFTLGSNPSDLWRYKRILACVDKWRSILAICGFHHSGYIGVSRPHPYYCETRRLKKFQLHSTFLALHKLAASPGPGQISLNLTFAHLFDDFFGGIEAPYVLGDSELSRIEFASRLEELDRGFKEEAIAYDEFGMWNLENLDDIDYNMLTTKDLIVIRDRKWEEILIDAQTRGGEMIDTLEELENEIISRSSSGETEHETIYSANPVRMHKSHFGQVLDDHERPELLLHACMASRHPWIESSCGTEYLEELIATQDVIFDYHHRLFRYNTSEALKVAASIRKWIRVLEACGLTTTRRTGVKVYAMGNTDPDYLPLLKSLMRTAYRLLPALAEKDREFKEAVKKDEMHLIARECFWDEEIPGAMASRDAKWKKFIETTREYTEKLLDMLEGLEENPVLLSDFHADEDRWPDAHGSEIADSEDEGLLSE
ncbi:hypothetical protein D6D04_05805 [Aureobasidium pullulans]|nr:hypothetical protein D6D04_05805 [Aureobasidium pullulans]